MVELVLWQVETHILETIQIQTVQVKTECQLASVLNADFRPLSVKMKKIKLTLVDRRVLLWSMAMFLLSNKQELKV
jgi:hypothetical protein